MVFQFGFVIPVLQFLLKVLILDIAHGYPEIQNVEDIVSTPVGDKYLVFLTIGLDGNMSTFESHELADSLENTINGLDKIYKTVVHVNPIKIEEDKES